MPFQLDPDALLADAGVIARTRAFAAAPLLTIAAPDASVCVLQAEVCLLTAAPAAAAATPRYIGSAEATTCCIVFVRSADGALVACSHLDFAECAENFVALLRAEGFFAHSLDVSLVGSFEGGEDCSKLVRSILRTLHGAPCALTLRVAAVLQHNRLVDAGAAGGAAAAAAPLRRRRPAVVSAALDVATGELRAAAFAEPTPNFIERSCRCFTQGFDEPLFCAWKNGAWAAPQLPGGAAPGLSWGVDAALCARFLAMPDAQLVNKTSTSPANEAADYAANMRKVLTFIKKAIERGGQ
jgi:hypothetical protein